ncbi:MAG: PDZ domain-containing protein [Planctomycetes bacterium]|nr:PDZ domain-containing protein [Planctomycetota bacterium]
MIGIDLNVYRFDYDLTFACLLMNADGTVYHIYGGRESESASGRLSMRPFLNVLRDTLGDHEEYQRNPSPPTSRPPRVVEAMPSMARRMRARRIDCVHCHTVYDMEREDLQAEGRFRADWVWKWPRPEKVGLRLDRDDPALVQEVVAGSAASRAGIAAGDRLSWFGGRRIRTEADVQWTLEDLPAEGAELPFEWKRVGESVAGRLALSPGWRIGDALDLAWRPLMWGVGPGPGFGGPPLPVEQKERFGLAAGSFAMLVDYLVDWGERPAQGKAARDAGLRKGDVLLSADGVSDFRSERHFQAWFRLTRKAGAVVELEVLRDGERRKLRLPVLP